MTLYMIGIGLWDEKDITVKGLESVKNCDYIYLENYTSVLGVSVEKLEKFYDKKITLASRELVEKNSDEILGKAKNKNTAFLVVGDVFGATTHTDLFLRAKEKNIDIEIIHNVSIINAVSSIGLELYQYGKTTSIPYTQEGFRPKTAYKVIEQNQKNGFHTLCLLDIRMHEKRFMTVNEAIQILLDTEKEERRTVFTEDTKAIGIARIGSKQQKIVYSTAKKLLNIDFGKPLHSLIIPGKLHFVEQEMLNLYKN